MHLRQVLRSDNGPVVTAVNLIGGKWSLLILRDLKLRPWRFNELLNGLAGVSHKVLAIRLHQMMDGGRVDRRDLDENPPHWAIRRRHLPGDIPMIDLKARQK